MDIDCFSPELIILENVYKQYDGDIILHDINLTLHRGDFMAVSGPNGGGKTTMLRIMLKLLKPTSGKVIYRSGTLPDGKLKIGYLPQKSMIDTKFPITVKETVMSGMVKGFFGRLPGDYKERYDETVALCGIQDILQRPVGVLSGGQLQRTLLARAIISRPEVLVLDEPLSYVDKQFEYQLYSIIEQISRTTTIVLVSHEMSVISGMANRHIIIDRGMTECHARHHYHPGECD